MVSQAITSGAIQYGVPIKESLLCSPSLRRADTPKSAETNKMTSVITEAFDDVVLRHTFPVFTGLGRCPIVNWDFAGAVSIFGPDALPVANNDFYQD